MQRVGLVRSASNFTDHSNVQRSDIAGIVMLVSGPTIGQPDFPTPGDGVQCALWLHQNSVVPFFWDTLQLEVILSFEIQDRM